MKLKDWRARSEDDFMVYDLCGNLVPISSLTDAAELRKILVMEIQSGEIMRDRIEKLTWDINPNTVEVDEDGDEV